MKFFILLIFNCFLAFSQGHSLPSEYKLRSKRDVSGALHIVTNHAQPIHEDVKPENAEDNTKPCPEKKGSPSAIEMGTVFQVTPPHDAAFEGKSLRKSSPLTSRFELLRSINRVVTLSVLIFTAVIEFYPMIRYLSTLIAFLLIRFELLRSINRVVTLSVLIFTAVIEFYPTIRYLSTLIAFLLM